MTAMGVFSNVGEIEDGMRTLSPPHTIVDADDAVAPDAHPRRRRLRGRPLRLRPPERRRSTGFTLHVRPGERVALVGRSGAGKTTAVSLLLRLYEVEGGRILLDGIDIRDLTQDALRAQIGTVRQETAMFNRSALDNIRYGRPERHRRGGATRPPAAPRRTTSSSACATSRAAPATTPTSASAASSSRAASASASRWRG